MNVEVGSSTLFATYTIKVTHRNSMVLLNVQMEDIQSESKHNLINK